MIRFWENKPWEESDAAQSFHLKYRCLPHWNADQQAIGSSQVFACAKCDAQDVDGTLYKTRVGSDTPRDVVFPNDHFGSILAFN